MLNKEAKMTRIIDGGAVLIGDRKTKYVGLRLSTLKENILALLSICN
jgi:hypothetical protein